MCGALVDLRAATWGGGGHDIGGGEISKGGERQGVTPLCCVRLASCCVWQGEVG